MGVYKVQLDAPGSLMEVGFGHIEGFLSVWEKIGTLQASLSLALANSIQFSVAVTKAMKMNIASMHKGPHTSARHRISVLCIC